MNFIDRINEYNKLNSIKRSNQLTCILITGEHGIGKSSLINNFFSNEDSTSFNNTSQSYFYDIVFSLVQKGFHEYLLNRNECNYKDIFTERFGDQRLQYDHIADFILKQNLFEGVKEVSIEEFMSDYILFSLKTNIIFDSFQECDKGEFGRILKLINCLAVNKNNQNITIVFAHPEDNSFIYERLLSMCKVIIPLSGLDKQYINILLRNFFNNEFMQCEQISDYLYKEYGGNPGKITSLLKLKFSGLNNQECSQITILNKIVNPEFYALDPTQKRIMLFLAVMPFSIPLQKLIDFLVLDPDFGNIDDIQNCEYKINLLADNNLVIFNNGVIYVNDVMKELYRQYSKQEVYFVHLIYRYQMNNKNNLKDRENADCLHFIMQSKIIEISEEMMQDYFDYTIKTANSLLLNELWECSVKYFQRLLPYKSYFSENNVTAFLRACYFSADYLLVRDFMIAIDDSLYKSFDYWYWKGTLLYMINDISSIECLKKAVKLSKNNKDRIYAQITLKQAISESPKHCASTLSFYESLLNEYKNRDIPELSVLYRNSLVLGGLDTVEQCKKGLLIAQRYNQMEEEIKLTHNMHFELFRMSSYDGCEAAFDASAVFFQKQAKRVYESAYGYNNLALLNLVTNNIDKAALYIMSAVIYAGTPYSIITTQVNSNLINSMFKPDKYDIEDGVNKINALIAKYDIHDERIFRKSYFSIAIAYCNTGNNQKAIEYIRKSEPYLQDGRHINRYINLCKKLGIKPVVYPKELITKENEYYNFYANPNYELWLLAYGHI